MAKKSAIEKNKHRRELVKKFAGRRERLLAVANDEYEVHGGALRRAPQAG